MNRRRPFLHVLAATSALALPAGARSIEGIELPEVMRVHGRPVLLNGAALLEATWLGLDIYVVGLYLRAREARAEPLLRCDRFWHVRMRFLRDIGRTRYRDGWEDALDDRPGWRIPEARRVGEQFLAAIPAVHEGDLQELQFDPDHGFTFSVNGTVRFRSPERTFCRMIIRGFVDDRYAPGGIGPRLLGVKPSR